MLNKTPSESLDLLGVLMNEVDVLHVAEAAPYASIIAVHMEAVNHWNLSRADLRKYAEQHQFSNQLFVPKNGDTLRL